MNEIPELVDYEVRIPPGGKTSALVECKIIWKKFDKNSANSSDEKLITTRGVDSDQVMAAVYATEKDVEYCTIIFILIWGCHLCCK